MVARFCIWLISVVSVQGAATAADFGKPRVSAGRQTVPGAYVTIEGGVRVIRPVPFDPGWVVSEETAIPGGTVYHGAAFYRVPSKAAHSPASKKPDKAPAE